MKYLMTRFIADMGCSPHSQEILEANIRAVSLDAGAFLVRQGEYAPNLYFICEGLVKMYYITADGKEFVKSFISEGQISGSLSSLMDGRESTFSIVCLEPVKAEVVSYDVFQKLVEADPEMLRFGYRFFQTLALKKELREHSFLCLTPQDRYQQFMEDNAQLADRVTQADIARYLGITPVALSRIRGRLKSPQPRDQGEGQSPDKAH